MSRNFDKLINKKISETNLTPSSGLWDKIEAELDEKENKKVIIPFWRNGLFKQGIAAAVIFLLGGLSATYFINDHTNSPLATTTILENNQFSTTDNENTQANIQQNNTIENKTTQDSNPNSKQSTTTIATNNQNTTQKVQSFVAQILNNSRENTNSHTDNETFASNTKRQSSQKQYTSASDYNWIYDKISNTYQVVLKQIYQKENNPIFIDNGQVGNAALVSSNANENNTKEDNNQLATSMMSIIEKEDTSKTETLEIPDIEDSYRQFKTITSKLNYQGFWLGPNVGYESVFAGGRHYAGGSFGVDLGYDFGGSIGIQSGIRYAINSKIIKAYTEPNAKKDYKSEFNSVHIPLMLRYKFTKITQHYSRPLSLNLISGLDYSYVNNKNIHQLGFVLGAEYDVFTQADLMFTIGVKGSLNNNLNLAKLNIPEKLNAFNYGLNAYISLRFIDWAKKK